MAGERLQDATFRALAAPRQEDLIAGVKHAVTGELKMLDPAVKVRWTDYFNHSFAPDMVLSWADSGREERGVYLRYSLQAAAAGHDVTSLADLSPILIALRPGEDARAEEQVKRELPGAPRVLLTDTRSLDEFSPAPSLRFKYRVRGEATTPVFDLVRHNLMRGGRGLLVGHAATRLAEQASPEHWVGREFDLLDEFEAGIDELFLDDAAVRLTRAAQLLRLGLSGQPVPEPAEPRGEQVPATGQLSEAELAVLLPFLLSRPDVTTSPQYWAYLGSMLTLADVERMWDRLLHLDLTRLVEPNLRTWLAQRASVEPWPSYLNDADGLHEHWRTWRIEAKTLSYFDRDFVIHVAADKRKLPGRDEAAPSPWNELTERLERFRLASVTLKGLHRTIRVDAQSSADVSDDIRSITRTVYDEFVVPDVDITAAEPEQTRVNVDFTKMLATAAAPVSVGELADIARGSLTVEP